LFLNFANSINANELTLGFDGKNIGVDPLLDFPAGKTFTARIMESIFLFTVESFGKFAG
jgi:hypothetical protein